jgi:uncharacterized membrane protein YtjA (UPF0391 family)
MSCVFVPKQAECQSLSALRCVPPPSTVVPNKVKPHVSRVFTLYRVELRVVHALPDRHAAGASATLDQEEGRMVMLNWALLFFVIALVAALLGFGGIATAAAGVAKILFYIFLVIFLVTLIMGLGRRGTRV